MLGKLSRCPVINPITGQPITLTTHPQGAKGSGLGPREAEQGVHVAAIGRAKGLEVGVPGISGLDEVSGRAPGEERLPEHHVDQEVGQPPGRQASNVTLSICADL